MTAYPIRGQVHPTAVHLAYSGFMATPTGGIVPENRFGRVLRIRTTASTEVSGIMSEHLTIDDDIVAVRHRLHEHPEMSLHEHWTTQFLREQLESHGINVLDTDLQTGLVAEIHGERPGPRIALRADIDALPIEEHSGLEFASRNTGCMHACGHDIHMSGLLAAAFWLAQRPELIHGSIVILFQPAEENAQGARLVVECGALGSVDAVIGTHNNPEMKPGQIAVGNQPMMAGCVKFDVTLHAQGAHGAHPDHGTGPIEALASMILSLQTIVSRNIPPFNPAVLSVTSVRGGEMWNVIPQEAGFLGTVRYFHQDDGESMERRFRTIVESTAQAYGITADVEWNVVAFPLVSDEYLAGKVMERVPDYAQLVPIIPSMGGEDFCNYQGLAPLVFASIGSNGGPGHHGVHSPGFVALDEAIKPTAEFYVNAALDVAQAIEERRACADVPRRTGCEDEI